MSVLVDEHGRVRDVVIIDSSGLASADNAAIDYMKTQPFSPAVKSGKPVESWVTIRVSFG